MKYFIYQSQFCQNPEQKRRKHSLRRRQILAAGRSGLKTISLSWRGRAPSGAKSYARQRFCA
jgi:hypothetical protein